MSYERVNWENEPSEETPVNADNLNKMDKGIKDIEDGTTKVAEADSADEVDTSKQFQVSGAAHSNESVSAGDYYRMQSFYIQIPNGKKLYLKKARFNFDSTSSTSKDFILVIGTYSTEGFTEYWSSSSSANETTPNVSIIDDSEPYIYIAAKNDSDRSITMSPSAGFWLEFTIE